LLTDEIFLTADDKFQDEHKIRSTTRVGVAYAAEDALLPYRFYVEGNRYVSSPPKKNK
jgi:DNA-3-methyladenine glycosylase